MRRLILFALALATLSITAPARADLIFRGHWPNESQVRAQFNRMPPRLQEKLKVSDLALQIGPSLYGYTGHYDDNPSDHVRTITVDDPYNLSLLAHESGHYYLEAVCTQIERDQWPHFFLRHRSDFPTKYSRTLQRDGGHLGSEAFAEAYRTVYDGSWLRLVIKDRLGLMGVPGTEPSTTTGTSVTTTTFLKGDQCQKNGNTTATCSVSPSGTVAVRSVLRGSDTSWIDPSPVPTWATWTSGLASR